MQLQIVTLLYLVSAVTCAALNSCREPDDYSGLRKRLSKLIENEYFRELGSLSFPDYFKSYKSSRKDDGDGKSIHIPKTNNVNTMTAKLYGDSKFSCEIERNRVIQSLKSSNETDEQNEKSVCPWDVVLEYDPLRMPATIAKARCLCEECLSFDALTYTGNGAKPTCVPVNSHIPVIRKTCVDGEYMYDVVLEPVPVGCACQRVL